jgi:hypothetical protein
VNTRIAMGGTDVRHIWILRFEVSQQNGKRELVEKI